jgi:fructokinase
VTERTTANQAGVITVIGEALIDLVPAERDGLYEAAPGGSPANVAIGLARLGVPVRFGARLADDGFGRRLRAHLAANCVDLSVAIRAHEPTSLAVVQVDEEGRVEYDFRVHATADWQWTDAELAGMPLDGVVAVHTGSLAAALVPGAEPIERLVRCSKASATISYDPNCRPALMGPRAEVADRVHRLVSLADVVKVSAEDLAWLAPGRPPAEVAATWLRYGPALVVVTLGADGALASTRMSPGLFRPGRRVDVVDTVGAGDAFVSALLAALHQHDLLGAHRRAALQNIGQQQLAAILDEAVLASAITCTRRGADPPTHAELLAGLAAA